MKKIDLHIHTIPTISDSDFVFSLEKLQEYIDNAQLDAIAITNHNLFDIKQFEAIKNTVKIKTFPGIEINLEKGHMILLYDNDDLVDFGVKCDKVSKKIITPESSISIEELRDIFGNLDNYLLIPHLGKSKKISTDTIEKLKDFITAGEVSSIKKFIRAKKEGSSLVPIYSSDIRIMDGLEAFPTKQTFVDCSEISLQSLKSCFTDKEKVSLSEEDGNHLFRIFDTGQKLSTGLNIVLGERSSGKTFMLDRIDKEQGNTKYIKQFSLVQNDESDERDFNRELGSSLEL
ncbi:MAG: hypothetical protein PF572_00800 [Patescibacteria group bacterium]|jgi:hypothetical protein|nr:hypothetical protein [Patescibacteria group bacterium]